MSAGVQAVKSDNSSGAGADAPQDGASGRGEMSRRPRRLLRSVVLVPVVAGLVTQRGSLLSAADRISALSPAWLVLALGAETVSFLAAAELPHHLLAGNGIPID